VEFQVLATNIVALPLDIFKENGLKEDAPLVLVSHGKSGGPLKIVELIHGPIIIDALEISYKGKKLKKDA
jgi:hypothetical protein